MFYGTEPYFKSGWNIMDGLLVIVSIIDLLMSLISETSPKIFGILRVSTVPRPQYILLAYCYGFVCTILTPSSRIPVPQVFRLLRSLRPLRVINRAPGLKLVVQTLLSSLRPIGNIVLICCTFFIIFGILGVQVSVTIIATSRFVTLSINVETRALKQVSAVVMWRTLCSR